MTVYLFKIQHKKVHRYWLVSRSAGKQLRGDEDEKLPEIMEQWEKLWGTIDTIERLPEMSIAQAEAEIARLRKRFLETKQKLSP